MKFTDMVVVNYHVDSQIQAAAGSYHSPWCFSTTVSTLCRFGG